MVTRNAAEQAEKQRRQRRAARLNLLGVAGLVTVLIGAAVAFNFIRDTGPGPVDAPAAGASEYGLVIGDDQAPTTVVVYEDFVCPFCGEFEAASADEFAALADQGKVLVDYRVFDLLGTDYSSDAAQAFSVVLAESGPAVASAFHDLLFEEQPEESGPFPDSDWYVDLAVQAGADEGAVRPGIEAGDTTWVDQATDEAANAGVEGTPTILLNGEVFDDYRDLEDAASSLVSLITERSATIEP